MVNVVWFKDLSNKDINIAGGKGASLGEMYNADLPIPPGFAVTAQAFKEFLQSHGLDKKIKGILDKLDVDKTQELQNTSKEIKEMVVKEEMSPILQKDILEAYENLNVDQDLVKAGGDVLDLIKGGRGNALVAVRSSATAEDLPSISENEYVFVKLNDKPFFGRMEDLVNKYNPRDKIEVPAMDKDFEVKWKEVNKIYQHTANDKKLFKITTLTGKEITISPNHTLITLDEENLQPKTLEIGDLKGGEKIPVIKKLPLLEPIKEIDILDYISKEDVIEIDGKLMIKNKSNNWKIQQSLSRKIKVTKDLAYFLGIYAAEGSNYGNSVSITNSNSEIMERIKMSLDGLGINYQNKLNKSSLRFQCKTLVRFLNENCGKPDKKISGKGKTCRTKRIPGFIFSCSREIIGEYLKGCFDGDGTIGKNCLSYTTVSEDLASGISTLFELLDLEYFIRRKGNAININLLLRSLEKFKLNIGFIHRLKKERLNNLLKEYQIKKNFEFKNTIKISKTIANKIKDNLHSELPKQKVILCSCPTCFNKLEKNALYKGNKRFYCKDCKKTYYGDKVIKKEIESYVNYDEKGRFLKDMTPWNKAVNTFPPYSVGKFKQILQENNCMELGNIFSESVIWDTIVKVEEVKYNSWVYDFCVPGVENFASGLGGIITHNSASFAGQQETFLNISGNNKLIEAVRKCWASLYTSRAIFYREKNNFPHEKVYISVIIQKQISSDKAGVMFSANPTNNNQDEILIEAGFGLGESVVLGIINPDLYIIDKNTMKLKTKKIMKQKIKIVRDVQNGETVKKKIPEEEQGKQVLNDAEIDELSKLAKKIEEHYKKPQDLEFAIEKNKVFIVQSRPITTLGKKIEKGEDLEGEVLCEGLSASPGIGVGKVRIVRDKDKLEEFQEGEVLVTEMTDPSYVPIMRKAKAIVTNEGGSSSHAAIVSRELGVPAIVGTENATSQLSDGLIITVDGTSGKVYKGEVKGKEETVEVLDKGEGIETKTKIYMNLGEPSLIDKYKDLNFDGIGLMRVEFIIASYVQEHPKSLIKKGEGDKYKDKLKEGVVKIAKAIAPRPVIVRFSDFKTNEYRGLQGGAEFEQDEENPMIGWRGVSRYVSEDFKEAFKLECKAIKEAREENKNVHVMLPFVRNIKEVGECLAIMKEEGLERNEEFKVLLMAEVPSMAIIPESFAKLPIDGCSIGSNDLTQLTLGVDRDSEKLGNMGYFNERDPAVLEAIRRIIVGFGKHNKTVGICGQSASTYKEIAETFVKNGATSISVNPDAVGKVRRWIAEIEKRLDQV